ncbi:MAG: hypothetical protein E6G57_17550 [Actinobacteria bacterium]|nr:MAG: hypothetical protein E6G57_17550 [Actinomycetota bacterium]
MIKFLNDITGGHLLLWKVMVTSVVFALAGLQVAMAARFWGRPFLVALSPGTAVRVHRVSGRLALTLGVLVALTCIVGPAGPLSPTRVALHSIFGILVFTVLAVKFLLLKVLRQGDSVLPLIGSLLFLAFGAIWATSVADYVAAK